MTKLSQCAKCDHDRRICGHYKPEDDTGCPHYARGGVLQEEEYKSDKDTIISLTFIYVIFICICGCYFDDAKVLYLLSIPLLVLLIWRVVIFIKNRKFKEKQDVRKMKQKVEKVVESQLTTRTLLQVALHKLNLQYDFDEHQNFRMRYQGDLFRIIADDHRLYLNIQYMGWYSAPLDDIDNLSFVYKAVNECNKRDTNRMVYTHHKIENEILLHALCDILWIPQIPDAEKYLQATLDGLLQSQHFFFRMMENLRREEFERYNS